MLGGHGMIAGLARRMQPASVLAGQGASKPGFRPPAQEGMRVPPPNVNQLAGAGSVLAMLARRRGLTQGAPQAPQTNFTASGHGSQAGAQRMASPFILSRFFRR